MIEIKMKENSSGKDTLRKYLEKLLITVINEGEGFSGKRAFGDSSWMFEIYETLIQEGLIPGNLDSDGCIHDLNTKTADEFIVKYIKDIFLMDVS